MFKTLVIGSRKMLLAGMLTSSIMLSPSFAQSTQETPAASSAPRKTSPYRPSTPPRSAKPYFKATWGIDSLSVKAVESGQLIRFNYRILDVEKAKALNDKKATPYLVDEKAGVKLVVPNLEKVGQLRQATSPEQGKEYWMVFSNKGGHVKRGDRVTVEIGQFRAGGLVVQ